MNTAIHRAVPMRVLVRIIGTALGLVVALIPSVAFGLDSCPLVITEDTVLQADLVCDGPTDGVVFAPSGASGVTLDLNGHTIRGSNGALMGVRADDNPSVTIKNGTIEGFYVGVALNSAPLSTVDNLVIKAPNGISIGESPETTVTGNGLQASGTGIHVVSSNHSELARNVVVGALFSVDVHFSSDVLIAHNTIAEAENGLTVIGSVPGVIENNDLSGSSGAGMDILGSEAWTISNNTIVGFEIGMRLDSSGNGDILDNTIESASATGLTLLRLDDEIVTGNVVSQSGSDGVAVFDTNEVVLSGNQFHGNGGVGAAVHTSINSVVRGNDARRNVVGFLIDSTSGSWVGENVAVNNDQSGFVLSSTSNVRVIRNRSVGNGEKGFLLYESHDDTLTENQASGHTADGTDGIYGFGFSLIESDQNTLESNTATDNYHGVRLDFADGNHLAANEADENVVGFDIVSSNGNTLTGNTASRNKERAGFELRDGSASNLLSENTADHNASWAGFFVPFGVDNVLARNVATKNKIGFFVWEPSARNTFDSNYGRNAWLDKFDRTAGGANTWVANDFKWVDGDGGWR